MEHPPFKGRKIEKNGKGGYVFEEYFAGDKWDKAMILYDDAHIFGEAVRCIDEMRAILVPEAKRAPERVERPVQHRMEYRRSINRIALPHWGDSDDRFMLGPTGKWYPKALCLREGDVRLVEWIDKTYSSNSRWLTDLVVDERRRRSGRMEYLVKFRGYELNPGVRGDPSNVGDWYTLEEGINQEQLTAFRERQEGNSTSTDED